MRHELATVLLGPIFQKQGQQVRQRISLLPEPPGERQGTAGSGPPLSLLIIGDSAGAGVGAAHQDEALSGRLVQALAPHHTLRWQLAARTGATVTRTILRLKRLEAGKWDWVVISLGANDVVSRQSLAGWRENLDQLHAVLSERFDNPQILFSGLPPMHLFPALPQPLRWYLGARAREFDQALAQWSVQEQNCTRLTTDFTEDPALLATDGFHPGPELYRLWAEAAGRHIRTQSAAATASGPALTPPPGSVALEP